MHEYNKRLGDEMVINTLYRCMSIKQKKQTTEYMRNLVCDALMSTELKKQINGGLNYLV